MKNILTAMLMFFGLCISAQDKEQFLFAYNDGNKTVLSELAVQNLAVEPEFPFTEMLNTYVANKLDTSKISGEGKSTTLLSLKFREDGTLEDISSIGENEQLNYAAELVFSEFIGRAFNLGSYQYEIPLEFNIPIVIQH